MIIRILLWIKHALPDLWRMIEVVNGKIFYIFYGKLLGSIQKSVFKKHSDSQYVFRPLKRNDIEQLSRFLNKQSKDQKKFFNPHSFTISALERLWKNRSFFMMGVFFNDQIIGYFFLRFFINKKCFIGRIVDTDFQRKGIANTMSKIMYDIAWSMSFRCLTTISGENQAIVDLHKGENSFHVLKELPNNYLFVEIMPPEPSK